MKAKSRCDIALHSILVSFSKQSQISTCLIEWIKIFGIAFEGKTHHKAKFQKTDLDMWRHPRDEKRCFIAV